MITVPAHDLRLVECKNGSLSLKVTDPKGQTRALHSLYDPEKEACGVVAGLSCEDQSIIVVLGLGLGYHVLELARKYPDADLIVVEALPEIHEMAKKCRKLDAFSSRIQCIVGASPPEALRQITRYQIKAGMRSVSVFPFASALNAFADYYGPIRDALSKASAVRIGERLKYKKFTQDTVGILLFDLNYYLTRELESAVRAAGCRVSKISIGKEESGEAIVSRLIDQILQGKPDFLLTINHLGFDEDGVLTSFLESIEMPLASWYVDSPNLIVKAFERNVSPYTHVFLWDREYTREMEAMGFGGVSCLPLASDTRVFRPIPPGHPKVKKHRSDVSFVGHSMVERVDKWISKLPGEVSPLVDSLAREMGRSKPPFSGLGRTLPAEDQGLLEQLSPRDKANLEAAVLARATLLYRLSCIEELRPFAPRVYGDPGWHRLLGPGIPIGPPVDYYRTTPFLYNACRINFNATSLQMRSAVNQRVFDVPACGAFLLTDHQESLGEAFEIGEEVIAFEHPGEIPDLVRFYLENPARRKAVAERGRQRVLREHTYRHRLNSMVEQMRARYREGP
jgi:spore maturation protein CgeB